VACKLGIVEVRKRGLMSVVVLAVAIMVDSADSFFVLAMTGCCDLASPEVRTHASSSEAQAPFDPGPERGS
jgi:hypothetical protein